ncbi:hypothetical protein ACTMS0_07070 [Micromonospora sp. H33]|uniref:hypothetical protein n=1 Tax=Micromonospora sp. H33 TaxID=3452215 RepID=UPI003F89007F
MEKVTAARRTLVTTIDRWFHLDRPLLVEAGQTYWVDWKRRELCVDRGDGQVRRFPGWVCR